MTLSICEQISDELVAFLDGELAASERRPIANHVATCLVCRREIDRLTAARRLVAEISRIEPSAGFAAEFWQRVGAEPVRTRPSVRARQSPRWALPALAAAALLVVAFQFMSAPSRRPASPVARDGPVAESRRAQVAKTNLAAGADAKPEAPQLANLDDLQPEDLPPALLEHPELFLRLPVVRRLETLEHLEAVHQEHGAEDGAG